MDRIKELKDHSKQLKRDISRNQKYILTSIGMILMISFSCLGAGVFLGLILDKMLKTIMIGIASGVILSTKSISEIMKYNRDIDDCEAQIRANDREISHLEQAFAREKQKEITQTKTETKSNNYSFKPNKYTKKTEEFNQYLNNLKDDGFFDYNEDNHKKR